MTLTENEHRHSPMLDRAMELPDNGQPDEADEHGRDLIVYHGRDYREIEGDPLYDPSRHTRVQPIRYREDGTPDFGIPVRNGPLS